MTAQDLIDALGAYPAVILGYFAVLPAAAWLLGDVPYDREGGKSAWDYCYSVIIYAVGVPGTASAVLIGYALFLTRTNLLEVKGLKPLPPGQTYRLWALTPDGQQGCASFQTDAQGNVRIQVPREPSGSAVSLLISVDPVQPGSAPTQPAKPVLMSI